MIIDYPLHVIKGDFFDILYALNEEVESYPKINDKIPIKVKVFYKNFGFINPFNPAKSKHTITLKDEINKILQDTAFPGIYLIPDFQIDDPVVIGELLDINFYKLKKQMKSISIIGDISVFPSHIQSLFKELDLSKQISSLKPKKYKVYNLRQIEIMKTLKQKPTKFFSMLEKIDKLIGFEEVGGLEFIKDYIAKYKVVRQDFPELLPKSLLFVGKTGCGKTFVSKAIAKELDLPLYRIEMGKLYNMYLGKTEENVRRLWQEINQVHPAVLLFDEVDKMFSGIESSSHVDAGTTSRVLSYMLYQLQEQDNHSLIIGTANSIDNLPEEFFRMGRWSKYFYFDPSLYDTQEIAFMVLRRYIQKDSDIAVKKAVKKYFTHPLCGAVIEEAIKNAVFNLIGEGKPVTLQNILEEVSNEII